MGLNYRDELNDPQYRAVTTVDGPLLIIAGAGSGKTRVITFRMAYMLERGIPQSAILALTFTNKAAREMAERVKSLTKKKLQNLTVSTFHAFGVKVLRDCITHLGYRENFSIYDQVDKTSLIREVAREVGIAPDTLDLYQVSTLFSNIKTGLERWTPATEPFQELYREYQSHLAVYNAVDFDDLIVLPIKLFEEHPETLERYREQYRYLMVDEFQDTSINQYRLMKLLADGSRNVCVVGDDDQSIYSWRGANYENIVNFEKDYPELVEIKLEQNYRSTGTILAAANSVIAHNTNRKFKELWTGSGGGKRIELYHPDDDRCEAEFIAESIKTAAIREGVKYHEVGILVRTNSLMRNIEEALLAGNIPCRISGGTSFFQRKEVKDMISYLRVISNPEDDINLLRIINTPRRGLGKKTIERLSEYAKRRSCSLHTAIGALIHAHDSTLPEKTKADLSAFVSLIESYRSKLLSGRNMAETVRKMVEEIDYWGFLVQEFQKNDNAAKWKFRNITLFTNFIEDWEKDPDNLNPSIYAYLNRISLITRDDLTDEDEKGKVNLMTIHAAKGLEFDLVFLAGVEENIIPHARAMAESESNLEEERRLFYVAITRARKTLVMTACRKRRTMREWIECSPSPFLAEIPPELVEEKEIEGLTVQPDEARDYFANLKKKFAS
jgi:DNA helicase-2/ATP-dependent DNA helicase PcrA